MPIPEGVTAGVRRETDWFVTTRIEAGIHEGAHLKGTVELDEPSVGPPEAACWSETIMPATRYKIWQMGNPVGRGATGSLHVGVAGVAKKGVEGQPFAVANELTCRHLASAILLPVPTGFIIEQEGVPYYVSLNFNLAGEDLPPVDAVAFARDEATLASGIVLFDIWIVNSDRNTGNLTYRSNWGRQVFDHGSTFFHTADGRNYLTEREDRLSMEDIV